MVAVADVLVTYLSSSYLAHTVTEVVQEKQMLLMPMLDLSFPLKHLVVVGAGAGEDDRSAVPHHHCLDPSFLVLIETTQHLAYYYYYY